MLTLFATCNQYHCLLHPSKHDDAAEIQVILCKQYRQVDNFSYHHCCQGKEAGWPGQRSRNATKAANERGQKTSKQCHKCGAKDQVTHLSGTSLPISFSAFTSICCDSSVHSAVAGTSAAAGAGSGGPPLACACKGTLAALPSEGLADGDGWGVGDCFWGFGSSGWGPGC